MNKLPIDSGTGLIAVAVMMLAWLALSWGPVDSTIITLSLTGLSAVVFWQGVMSWRCLDRWAAREDLRLTSRRFQLFQRGPYSGFGFKNSVIFHVCFVEDGAEREGFVSLGHVLAVLIGRGDVDRSHVPREAKLG